jgi:hypothetical protein
MKARHASHLEAEVDPQKLLRPVTGSRSIPIRLMHCREVKCSIRGTFCITDLTFPLLSTYVYSAECLKFSLLYDIVSTPNPRRNF